MTARRRRLVGAAIGLALILGTWLPPQGASAVLLLGIIVVALFMRAAQSNRTLAIETLEFPPTLRLNPLAGLSVAPEVLEFPARGKLRIGSHPPCLDGHVGHRDFARLPYQNVRGDDASVRDLSRHEACIWRDPRTNDCYIQVGWPGPGEPIRPRPRTQVFHFGRPQDATSQPFRLSHHDVVRLSSGVEFVFNQVGLRESKNVSQVEPRRVATGRIAVLPQPAQRQDTYVCWPMVLAGDLSKDFNLLPPATITARSPR